MSAPTVIWVEFTPEQCEVLAELLDKAALQPAFAAYLRCALAED